MNSFETVLMSMIVIAEILTITFCLYLRGKHSE